MIYHALFEFQVMPFGPCNAPGIFQRLMEFVLTWLQCLVYLDDVIAYGRDFDEHLERLREVPPGRPEVETVKMVLVMTQSTVPWSCDLCRRCQHWSDKGRSSSTVVRRFPSLTAYYQWFIRTLLRWLHLCMTLLPRQHCDLAFRVLRETLVSVHVLAFPCFD